MDTMTINEILEQVKTLSPQERKELAKMLIDMMDAPQQVEAAESEEHWGKNLLQLLDEVGPVDLIYPEIEDPVEWVKQIRRDQQQKRLGDWGENE
jgi:uncharacterized tellurite resistance protein B-like protein